MISSISTTGVVFITITTVSVRANRYISSFSFALPRPNVSHARSSIIQQLDITTTTTTTATIARRNRDLGILYAEQPLRSSSSSSCMGGVSLFEQWWEDVISSSSCQLQHTAFDNGQLRGLELQEGDSRKQGEAVVVPRDLILRAPLRTENGPAWDANLAIQLLKECEKGKQSTIYGYCSLLYNGVSFFSDAAPPPTAVHALRHWSPVQQEALSSSVSGQKLLQLEREQTKTWNAQYDACPPSVQRSFSRESFLWALEAVHSRAFTGDFGPLTSVGRTPALAGGAVQVAAVAMGIKSLLEGSPSNDTDGIVAACAAVATLPLFLLTARSLSSSGGEAVLLPMIDSANHRAEADSSIEYDPWQDGFRLKLGAKCFGDDGQVFISYGTNKSDYELLLNYGFLSGVEVGDDAVAGGASTDDYRTVLAKEFLKRN